MNTISQSILEDRVSTGRFDSSISVSNETIHELIRLSTKAPSAFHMQNWHFIAVKSDEQKRKLQSASYGQRQVVEAAVTFIVCGLLNAHKSLSGNLQPSVDAGIIPESLQHSWTEMARASHENNARQQRDEAIRSASLAAMSLLVAAKEMGLDAGAIGGFDPLGLHETFQMKKEQLPVILIPVGRASDLNWPQKIRRPVSDVLQVI